MKYETCSHLTLPKIGFGTWKIGGESSPNPKMDSVSFSRVAFRVELGYTHIDTAENYAAGHAEELIGQAVRDTHIKRNCFSSLPK